MSVKLTIWLRILVPGLACLIWGALLFLGTVLTSGVKSQGVPGYPNTGQIVYYQGIPAAAFALALALLAASFKWKGCGLSVAAAVLMLALLPFLLFYTGGV